MPRALDLSHLYAIRCHGGVKIGITANLAERLGAIRRHNPLPLTIEHSPRMLWHQAQWAEKELRARLNDDRIWGEWFSSPPQRVAAEFGRVVPMAISLELDDPEGRARHEEKMAAYTAAALAARQEPRLRFRRRRANA